MDERREACAGHTGSDTRHIRLGYAAVDLFTCGDKCDPKVSYEFLKRKFNSKKATFTELKRGIIDEETMKVMEKPFEIMQQSID